MFVGSDAAVRKRAFVMFSRHFVKITLVLFHTEWGDDYYFHGFLFAFRTLLVASPARFAREVISMQEDAGG